MTKKVIESWKHVTSIDNYEEVAGRILFTKIFTIAPDAYQLFPFSKDYEILSDEMFDSPKFNNHAIGVIRTVDKAVGMLQDADLSDLVDVLKNLGKRHTRYGVVEAHYAIVGNALIQTLEEALGDEFTADIKDAWVEVWGVISKAMIEGAGY